MSTLLKYIIAIVFLSMIFIGKDCYAQTSTVKQNSIHTVNDSIKVIVKDKPDSFFVRKFKQFFVKKKTKSGFVEDREDVYIEHEDKTIRRIFIRVLEPFGISIQDTTIISIRWIDRVGNILHNSTKKSYVKRLISFNEGDEVSSWELADNERFLRKMSIFNDVEISLLNVDDNTVDVVVLCEDVFSIAAEVNTDLTNKFDLSIFHKNLFGIGHQLLSEIEYDKRNEDQWGFGLSYMIKNLSRSYIDLCTGIKIDEDGDTFTASLKRDFVLSSTKWAGEISFRGVRNASQLITEKKKESDRLFGYMFTDSWLGYSYNIFNNYKTIRNITYSAAYQRTDVFGGPINPLLYEYYMNRQIYLINLTFTERSYHKTNYIYDLGRTEDIVEGCKLDFTLGYEENEDSNLWYSGFQLARSWFFKKNIEYLAARISYGSFCNNKKIERGVVEFKIQSISKLFSISNYRMRFNTNLSYMIGFNRYAQDYITFEDYIRGLKSNDLRGTQKIGIGFTHNIFVPFMVNSFRSSIFVFADVGWIGDNNKFIFNTNDYYGIGVGVKINNDNLIFKTFSFRLAYYPKAPTDFRHFNAILRSSSQDEFINLDPQKPSILEYR